MSGAASYGHDPENLKVLGFPSISTRRHNGTPYRDINIFYAVGCRHERGLRHPSMLPPKPPISAFFRAGPMVDMRAQSPTVATARRLDAYGLGLGVTEYDTSSHAASEVRDLWQWMINKMERISHAA